MGTIFLIYLIGIVVCYLLLITLNSWKKSDFEDHVMIFALALFTSWILPILIMVIFVRVIYERKFMKYPR